MAESVKPTRMEMLNQKQKLILAEKGHKLLKQKRDVLIMEFFQLMKESKDLRSELNRQLKSSFAALAISQAIHGSSFVKANALLSARGVSMEVRQKNIMGVKIPVVKISSEVKRKLQDRGYSISGTSAAFDDVIEEFEKSLDLILKTAESETALKRLLKEIEKTNRRVNALEFNIQPGIKKSIKEIQSQLNRLESERFFALKLTKKRLSAAASTV